VAALAVRTFPTSNNAWCSHSILSPWSGSGCRPLMLLTCANLQSQFDVSAFPSRLMQSIAIATTRSVFNLSRLKTACSSDRR
jgi:hypothetical protein